MPNPAHPVRKIGRQPYRRYPLARLSDIQADARLSLERDLREAPTPISGGMRKALNKERGAQDALRFRSGQPYRQADTRRSFDLIQATCAGCGHVMFFDEIEADAWQAIRCDRCKRLI